MDAFTLILTLFVSEVFIIVTIDVIVVNVIVVDVITVVGAEQVIDIRFFEFIVVEGNQLCFPIHCLLRNKVQNVEETVEVGVSAKL